MNLTLVHQFIDQYKKEFFSIHTQEIYKWQAVKHFQNNWDIDHPDFSQMLSTALSRTSNLMASGNYYPRRVIKQNAKNSPTQVKSFFVDLFDEDIDLIDRIKSFSQSVKQLNQQHFPNNKKHFQDQRAVMVYLSLRYPNSYFFYKYTMFKDFCQKLNYPYQPQRGRYENIGQFMSICQLLREEISKDQDLLRLHTDRITTDCYIDKELHILTQDFIYAVVNYFPATSVISPPTPQSRQPTITRNQSKDVETQTFTVDFSPQIIDHQQRERRNKRIGDLGELWVMEYEKDKLTRLGQPKLAKQIEHIAKSKGDGTGYDIASFDQNGNSIFIEVKTTTGNLSRPFFITRNELERSQQERDNYYLYRVYNFNESTGETDVYIVNGELSKLCQFPTQYKAGLITNP